MNARTCSYQGSKQQLILNNVNLLLREPSTHLHPPCPNACRKQHLKSKERKLNYTNESQDIQCLRGIVILQALKEEALSVKKKLTSME